MEDIDDILERVESFAAPEGATGKLVTEFRTLREQESELAMQLEQLRSINIGLQETQRKLLEGIKEIARIEQSHCYVMLADSGISDTIQTRYDLRQCGDIARDILKLGQKPL